MCSSALWLSQLILLRWLYHFRGLPKTATVKIGATSQIDCAVSPIKTDFIKGLKASVISEGRKEITTLTKRPAWRKLKIIISPHDPLLPPSKMEAVIERDSRKNKMTTTPRKIPDSPIAEPPILILDKKSLAEAGIPLIKARVI